MLYAAHMNAQAAPEQNIKTSRIPTSKPYHHGDLQREILCAAREMLEEKNLACLSLRAVAKKVGVSHAAPYRHFKDKESLLAGIATIGFMELSAQISAAVELHPGDPAAQLQEAGHRYVQLVQANPQCVQLMFGGILPCDDTYPELRAAGDLAFDGLKNIIEAGQSSGAFKQDDIELSALTAWSCIHGLAVLFINGNLDIVVSTPLDVHVFTRAVTKTLLEGLQSC